MQWPECLLTVAALSMLGLTPVTAVLFVRIPSIRSIPSHWTSPMIVVHLVCPYEASLHTGHLRSTFDSTMPPTKAIQHAPTI